MIEGLTEGRVVHYVLAKEDGVREHKVGQHRPAMVVMYGSGDEGLVNLAVFVDGSNDIPGAKLDRAGIPTSDFIPPLWRTSVRPDFDDKEPGSWHWIERA